MRVVESRCRLCCEEADQMMDIFDDYGRRKCVREKITDRLHIFVGENDILPKTVCIICYGKLESYDMFLKKVQETQKKLLEFVQNEIKQLSATEARDEQNSMNVNDDSVICISDGSDFEDDVIEIGEEHEEKYDKDFEIVESMTPVLPNSLKENSTSRPAQYIIERIDNDKQVGGTDNLKFKIVMAGPESRRINTPEKRSILVRESKPLKVSPAISNQSEVMWPFTSKYPGIKDFTCQVGNSIATDLNLIENEILKKNPSLNLDNMLVTASVFNLKDDPTKPSISSDSSTTKGSQTTILLALKSRIEHAVWSVEQKKFLAQYFHSHFIEGTVPSLTDCRQLIKTAKKLFQNKTDQQIRQYFNNRKYSKNHYARSKKKDTETRK